MVWGNRRPEFKAPLAGPERRFMHSLHPSRPAGAEALEPAPAPSRAPAPTSAADAAEPARLHFLSLPSLLWTAALLLWWWAMEGAELVMGVVALVDVGAPGPRSLVLGALAVLALVVVALIHFVVVASAEVLRWLWHAAVRWLGLDG